MKALVFNAVHQPLEYKTVADPDSGAAIIQLKAAALNHRDVFITQGLYANIKTPCILGSDGAGIYNGQAVVLYPALDWGEELNFQGPGFRVLGMPEDGCFASLISVPQKNIFPMPAHLDFESAAALPLAGLTAWRTLFTRCAVKADETVLISGVGGGVALMAMQFAIAAGAKVFVTSGSQQKIEKAIQMGAAGGANYREEHWDKQLKQASGGFDVIIDSAGGDSFSRFPGICNPGGRIGFYGGTNGKVNGLSLQIVFWKQLSLLGSTMGSPEEFQAMLDFVEKHHITPVVDAVYPLAQGNEAMEKMKQGGQFGKLVLQI